MSLANGPARIMAVAALMALLIGPMLFSASSALAQGAPAILYGTGLEAGQTVTASIGDVECASATVNDDGQWEMQIESSAACNPTDGDTISFAVDGHAAEQVATYVPGVAVDDVANGITLTLAAMDDGMEDPDDGMEDPDDGMEDPDDGMEDPDDGMEDPDDGMDSMTPGDKGDTGNAGLATQSGTSALAVLALGVLALAGVAGARTVTGRID